MLELRPNCECCNADLAPDQRGAWICSFECTFCAACTQHVFGFWCPNCGGDLVPRPTRRGQALQSNPASQRRVVRDDACAPYHRARR
jgi:hypothetical protein